jgi:putative lipoprotein
MIWVCKPTGVIILIILLAPLSRGSEKDRWFAKDKYEHFAFSAAYAAGSTVIAHRHFEMSRKNAPVIGFGFTISLGAAKEGADHYSHKGLASPKDFIWDIAGALTGALAVGLSL